MKKLLSLFLTFIFINILIFPQIDQGEVLINSFDPSMNGLYNQEFVVLVNRTASSKNLFGYEIKCYDYNGCPVISFVQFNLVGTDYTIPPYGFYLISNQASVYGISRDLASYVRIDPARDHWIDGDGYLTLKRITTTPFKTDYIDIVKYNRTNLTVYPFIPCTREPPAPDPHQCDCIVNPPNTPIPPNSEIIWVDDNLALSMPIAIHDIVVLGGPSSSTYLTRKGESGNFSNLTYTGYGMIPGQPSDFTPAADGDITYIQNSGSAPLPVELNTFSAIMLNANTVKLSWMTQTEVNNYGFEVERQAHTSTPLSMTGWQKIGFVNGNGNSNSPKQYSFIDSKLIGGTKFKYRLKQIDNDGQFEYSDVIEVNVVPTLFELNQNYPNPFNPSTKIRYQLPFASKVIIKVYNILGSEVMELVNEQKEAGIYDLEFNAENLSSGTYIYKMSTDNFVQTKKMILLK